jgi:hypothetical protein
VKERDMSDKKSNTPSALERIFGIEPSASVEGPVGVETADELLIPRKGLATGEHARKLVSESAPLARAWARFEANLESHPDQELPPKVAIEPVARGLRAVRAHIAGLADGTRPECIELNSDWVFGREPKRRPAGDVEDAVPASKLGIEGPSAPAEQIERDIYMAWSLEESALRIELAWGAPEAGSTAVRWQKWFGIFSPEVESNERLFDELRDKLQGNHMNAWYVPDLYVAMARFLPQGYPAMGDWPLSHATSLRTFACAFYSVDPKDRERLTVEMMKKRFSLREMPTSENRAAFLLLRLHQSIEADRVNRERGKSVAPLVFEA